MPLRLIALLLLPGTLCFAQGQPAAGLHIESNSPERFALQIELQTRKAVNSKLNAVTFALESNIITPIPPQRNTHAQVEQMIEALAESRVEKEYPRGFHEQIKEEAAAVYKMWEIGDTVKISFRHHARDKGRLGRLEAKTSTRVIVSSMPVAKEDLHPENLARLYVNDHEEAIQRYIRVKTDAFTRERERRLKQIIAELETRMWPENEFEQQANNRWRARKVVFDEVYSKKWQSVYRQLRPQFQKSIYEANGGVYDEINSVWTFPDADEGAPVVRLRPPQRPESRSLLARFRRLFLGDAADQPGEFEPESGQADGGFTAANIFDDTDIANGRGASAPAVSSEDAPPEEPAEAETETTDGTGIEPVNDLYEE